MFLSVAANKPTSGSLWGHDVINLKLVIKRKLTSCVYVAHALGVYDVMLYMVELCC